MKQIIDADDGRAVAEYVVAAVLAHAKRLSAPRPRSPACWRHRSPTTLAGQTLGLAGAGAAARSVASLVGALGMRVLAWPGCGLDGLPIARSPGELAMGSDHLVLAGPCPSHGRGPLVDSALLDCANPGLHLVNVADGVLVDQEALIEALNRGLIAAATLAVTTPDPLPEGHPLWRHPCVRLSPCRPSGAAPPAEDAELPGYPMTVWQNAAAPI